MVHPGSGLHAIFWNRPFPDALAGAEGARHAIGIVGGILAVAVMFYTGILLASNKPIAFWSTAMLPVLFMISALLSGMMSIVLIAMLAGQPFEGAVAKLQYIIAILLLVQAMVLVFYLQGTHRAPESRASAKLVLFGEVAPLFWIGVAGIGLARYLTRPPLAFSRVHPAGGGKVVVFTPPDPRTGATTPSTPARPRRPETVTIVPARVRKPSSAHIRVVCDRLTRFGSLLRAALALAGLLEPLHVREVLETA
jgi:hypothetical protein